MKTCCTVLYEGWQMQCCGQPFRIGDMVRWDVFAFNETITDIPQTIEYIYDAHYETSDGLLTLQGIVHQINAIYTKYKASTDNPQLLVPVSSLLKSLVKSTYSLKGLHHIIIIAYDDVMELLCTEFHNELITDNKQQTD